MSKRLANAVNKATDNGHDMRVVSKSWYQCYKCMCEVSLEGRRLVADQRLYKKCQPLQERR